MNRINMCKEKGKEELFEFLKLWILDPVYINIDKSGFSREIQFKTANSVCVIQWFINQSYLIVENNGAQVLLYPFKFVGFQNTFPREQFNKSLVFSDHLEESGNFPFGGLYVKF